MAKQKTVQRDREKPHTAVKPNDDVLADKAKPSASKVALLFAVSFIIHVILNMLVKENAKVIIDEALYTNIARSLAWEGKLAFRGQPVNYPYLLYPVLLVPIYWISRLVNGDVYRFIQAFNTLLIASSVFPAYRFANDFTKDQKKAFIAAVIVACMPDMIMGGYEMTESLIWPLSLWMVFCCYRFFTTNQLRYGLLTALFTGLMFAAKPGAIAVGAVMLVIHAVRMIRTDKSGRRNSLFSLLFLLAVVGVVYGIYVQLFGGLDSLLGLYTKQTSEWKPQDILVAIEATFLTVFLFIFACGGIYGVFPLTHLSDYDGGKRHFILSFLMGVLAAIIGTAIFVVPYKWTGALGALPLHLRYCSMFIPILYVFSADIDLNPQHIKRFAIALTAFIALSLFPGARAGFVKDETTHIDSIVLSAFVSTRKQDGKVMGWVLTILVVCFCFYIVIYVYDLLKGQKQAKKPKKKKYSKSFHKAITLYFVAFLLFNSACAYVSSYVFIDPTISADALEVNQKTEGIQCLGIMQRDYDDINSFWLESRLVEPMQQVTIDEMCLQMVNSGGIYSPFVPHDQSPNVNNHETLETDTFVLNKYIAEHLELRDSVVAEKTANGHFTIVHIQPSERWVDTMMYGLSDNEFAEGKTGLIRVFDDDRNIDGNLILSITAYGKGQLTIGGQKLELEETEKTYVVSIPFKRTISFEMENGSAQILSYSTQKQ